MKIIKQGKPPNEDLFHGTCHRCKTEVEFTRNEANKIDYDQKENGEYAEVTCPVCDCTLFGYPK